MRRVDQLITAARIVARNTANADGTYAISDNEAIQYFNDAQDRLQNLISSTKNIAKIFVTQQIISVAASQEGYAPTDRVLLNKQIENVEYSATGLVTDYVRLEKLNFINRDTNSSNYPWGYIKRGGLILLQPTPATGSPATIRVTYERDLDDLDIPRGTVSSITTGTSVSFAALVLTAGTYGTTTPGFSNIQYVSVVDANGARKAFNIPVGSYNSGTFTITPTGSLFTYSSLDTQIAAGDTVVFNKYTTTFSQLPDSCERYLIHSTAADLFHKDSSTDLVAQQAKVDKIEKEILVTLASQTSEVQLIPLLDRYEYF